MRIYLFSDDQHFHREIKANTARGALLKARTMFGIRVALRLNQHTGNMRHYLSRPYGYGCAIIGPV